MKKIFFTVFLLCAAFAVFAQSGIIQELTGEVELKPAGASAFTPARAGSTVAQDTIVSTGFKGTAIIAVGSSTIIVRPLTRLSLSEIQTASGTENISMNLQAGRVRVDVKPPEGTRTNFTVQSPSATASVRGTGFDMDVLNLSVYEGTVSYQNNNGVGMLVAAGLESSVGNDGKVVDPLAVFNDSLLPEPPVGTDAAGTVSVTPVPPSLGEIVIEIQYW